MLWRTKESVHGDDNTGFCGEAARVHEDWVNVLGRKTKANSGNQAFFSGPAGFILFQIPRVKQYGKFLTLCPHFRGSGG